MVDGEDIMTKLFDWAIFGEIDRRHGLINSSVPVEMRDRLSGLATFSDRPSSDPPPGEEITPYLSGFPYDRWYVLMRTFLDPTAVRGGMVRSFCLLLLPIDELERLNDLSILIDCLPANDSSPNEWNIWKGKDSGEMLREREPADIANLTPLSTRLGFVDALLRNQLPGIWTDNQDDFESVLVGIWALLPPEFRSILRFGKSYFPNDLGEPKPHFVTTPKNAAARWEREKILKPLDREIKSRAELYLLGDISANSLGQFLLSLSITEFRQIKLADDCLEAFEDAERGEISQAVEAAVFINTLAPELHQARELKERSLSILENILQTAATKDIRYFANLQLDAFENARERLEKLLTVLVKNHLKNFHNIDLQFVEWAFNKKTAAWWRNAVSNAIVEQVKSLSTDLAISLWGWWSNNPELVLPLKEHLPSNADLLLHETTLAGLDKEKANSLLRIFSQNLNSQSNNFPRLLTYLEVKSGIPNDRILQTCLKRSSDVDIALNVFRKYIGDRVFLDLALTVSDERVFIEAGNCCFEDSTLLNQIEPDNVSWRKIWLVAIEAGADPLAGIPQPNEVITTVLDEFLAGKAVDKNLLIALSHTPVANLIDYSSRTEIWSKLPFEAKGGFLEATTKGVFDRWREDSNFQPEPELNQSILKLGCFTEAVRRSDRGLDKLTSHYMVFLAVSNGSSSNAEEVISVLADNNLAILDLEIKQFAAWIRKNNWTPIAEIIFKYYQNKIFNTVLHVLVEHTLEILPCLTKLHAIIDLKRPTAKNDFYASLRDVLSRLFSKGPNADGFWDDVGGKSGDLKLQGTVSEAWYSAINAVQQGKVPLDRVIKLARERYPLDLELRELERFSHKL
jgi:GTPase-associated protein 1, N-terminal domain type 1/Effector-associated domain 1